MARYKCEEGAAPPQCRSHCLRHYIATMGRKVLLALLCWLTSSGTLAAVVSSASKDLESAESAPRLYRNSNGVYASAAPHGAYSIQIPLIYTQKAAASSVVPVKESVVFGNANGYLKDSYGNRFVGTPHGVSFKAPFAQQFVQLQELPSHFAQPLAAAPPSFQYKQAVPQSATGSHYRFPVQAAAPHPSNHFGFTQPRGYAESFRSLSPSSSLHSYAYPTAQFHGQPTQVHARPTAQQQSTSNRAVYANTHPHQQYYNLKPEPKFQRLQHAPQEDATNAESHGPNQQLVQSDKGQLQAAPAKQTAITTIVNGKKTVIQLDTAPVLPLLDISLLEPLTFANPLVPQVQHFLPRIHQATYHKLPAPNIDEVKNYQKEFVMQNTQSYDSGIIQGKPKKGSPKKKQHRPQPEIEIADEEEEAPPAHVKPTITVEGTPNESPEFSYEINSPNYKETYKEKKINYNKETQSEPVNYSYGSKSEKPPVHYSYVRTSEEPAQLKEVHYQSKNGGPVHLVYNIKPEEKTSEEKKPQHSTPPAESEEEESDQSEEEGPAYQQHVEREEDDEEAPPPKYQQRPEHREEEYHHRPSQGAHHGHNVHQDAPPVQYYTAQNAEQLHPIAQYEEDIEISAPIKVDPEQHLKHGHSESQQLHPSPAPLQHLHSSPAPQQHLHSSPAPQQHLHASPAPQHVHSSPAPQQHPHPSPVPHTHHPEHESTPYPRHHAPAAHIQEKMKQVIIQEETPEDMRSFGEQLMTEMLAKSEDNEQDFEEAYKNAAFGFPAFNKAANVEKEIYSPETYGVSRDNNDYNVNYHPFQQYQDEGDEYPKTTRLDYKDMRDKTKEEYFLDYSVSKPESLSDRYKNKENYYKLYKKQTPEKYFPREDEKKKEKQSEKYTAAPSYEYHSAPQQKPKQYFAQYKAAPVVYEYDYSKGQPRDNSAHASRPFQSYKSKTNFVEPQFQFGFEPISIPRLLDSELAAMASNDSPESEKPGMRKKVYKENWYIKKTSTGEVPAS